MLASLYSVVSEKMWTRRNFSSVEHLSPAETASVAANSYVYCSSPCPCTSTTVVLSSAAETHSIAFGVPTTKDKLQFQTFV